MTTTADLGLPELAQAQAFPEITFNETIVLLQTLAASGVIDKDLTAPPGSPTEGDAYLINTASPTGAWALYPFCIAVYWGNAWRFIPGVDDAGTPLAMGSRQQGLRVWVRDENVSYVWRNTAGSPLSYDWVAVEDLPAATVDDTVLRRTGGALNFGALTAGMFTDNTVALARLVNATAQYNIVGRKTAAAGAWENCTRTELNLPILNATNNFTSQQQINLNTTAMSLPGLAILHIAGADASTRTSVVLDTYGASSIYVGRRANGTAAAPTPVLTGQNLLSMASSGYGDTGYISNRASITLASNENWSDTAAGTNFAVNLIAPGTTTITNGMLRVDTDRGIQVGGGGTGNIVIDQNRIHRMRVYTVATLPAAGTAGRRAAVSDANAPVFGAAVAGGGAVHVPVYDTGAAWFVG